MVENEFDFQKELAQLPEYIPASFHMESANQEVPIFEGIFLIKQAEINITVSGTITFTWFPEKGAKFQTDQIIEESHPVPSINMSSPCEIYINNLLFGKGWVTSFTDMSFLSGFCSRAILGDPGIKITRVRFSIPNLLLADGEKIKKTYPDSIRFFHGRQLFEHGPFSIVIDKSDKFDSLQKELKKAGGYLFTCGGEITSKKGSFSLNDIEDLLLSFQNFISFVNGRVTSIYFLKGEHEDEIIWEDFTNYTCEPFKEVTRWSNVAGLFGLNDIWINFSTMWKDADKKDFLLYAIHWYLNGNAHYGSTEGSIIFVQTGLELVYNWFLIEQKKLILGNDASSLSASNKIRLILSQLSIPREIPVESKNLKALPDVEDGAEVFTLIRNALVHGQEKKRRDLRDIGYLERFEALELGLWYLELSLLYIIGYDGKYNNRIKRGWFGLGETLPWQPNTSEKTNS
jgi:hypothetical protein